MRFRSLWTMPCLVSFLFSSYLDALENLGAQHVDAGVDLVTDKLLGLLDKTLNVGAIGTVHNDTVLGRIIDLGDLDTRKQKSV